MASRAIMRGAIIRIPKILKRLGALRTAGTLHARCTDVILLIIGFYNFIIYLAEKQRVSGP